MNYFLKRFPELPYTVTIALSLVSWALLCASLGFFLILSQADFEATGTRTVFIFNFALSLFLIGELPAIIEYGGFGVKGNKRFQVLNKNIKAGRILSDISDKDLKIVLCALISHPRDGCKISLRNGGLVLFFILAIEYLASNGMITNFFTIFVGGAVGLFLLSIFLIFFSQHFVSPALKECRKMLSERGIRVKEPRSALNNLETKLIISFTIPIFTVLIIAFVFQLDLKIIIFVLISLIMAALISKVLSFSISQAFAEIKDFTTKLSENKKVLFSTGSLNPEVVDLSVDLNRAAEEVYASRIKTERSRTELKKRVNELEKWKVLIVGRELKMAELKKEKKELKLKLKTKNA